MGNDRLHANSLLGRIIAGWPGDIGLAGQFLTRLPFPSPAQHKPDALARATRAFPILGALVGGIAGGVMWLAAGTGLHPLACAFLGLVMAAWLTGGLHEDGLADVADAMGARERTRRLEIMRDSRIGAYGVLALVLAIGLKAAILSGMPGPGVAWGAFFAAAILSRAVMAPCMLVLRPARSDGLGHGAGRPHAVDVAQGLVLSLAAAIAVFGWLFGLAAMAMALVGAGAMAWVAWRRFGGYTGDVLGAAQQVAEIAVLLLVGAYIP